MSRLVIKPCAIVEIVPRVAATPGADAHRSSVPDPLVDPGESFSLFHCIEFAFDRIPRQPNTRHAHALLAAAGPALQDRLATALFVAYFVDGRDLTDDAVLIDVATATGMDPAIAAEAIADEGLAQQIAGAEARAQALGVTGVPFFIFDGRVAVSGAHDPAVLLEAMREARRASDPS